MLTAEHGRKLRGEVRCVQCQNCQIDLFSLHLYEIVQFKGRRVVRNKILEMDFKIEGDE
jgi:hypothetical protein